MVIDRKSATTFARRANIPAGTTIGASRPSWDRAAGLEPCRLQASTADRTAEDCLPHLFEAQTGVLKISVAPAIGDQHSFNGYVFRETAPITLQELAIIGKHPQRLGLLFETNKFLCQGQDL